MKARFILPLATTLAFTHSTKAQEISKANNSDPLNVTTSWVGGSLPGTGNVAVWDNTVTAANSAALGSNLDWAGLKLTNPGGAVTITDTNTLTLGSSGIDLSSAAQNLTLTCGIIANADQNWNVATGRTLTLGNTTANTLTLTGNITLDGPGTVQVGGTSLTNNLILTGPGDIIINNGTLFNSLQTGGNSNGRTGATTLNAGNFRISTSVNMLGSGVLNLNGGTIGSGTATGRTLTNPVKIGGNVNFGGSGFSSGSMTFSGTTDLGGETRTLTTNVATTFSGPISNGGIIKAGTANLTLSSSANSFAGPVTINTGTLVLSGLLGSGSYAGDITNNATFTVSSSGIQTLSGNISGTGSLNRSGAGTLTLAGTNTYTGLTTVSGGAFILDGTLTSNISVTTANTRIGGTGSSTGSLTVGTAGTSLGLAGGTTTTSLTVNGATLDGPVAGRFLNPPVGGTTYDVLSYGSAGVTNPENVSFFGRGTLNHDTVNQKFTFTATEGPQTRTWAAGTGNWDATATLSNWAEGDQKFYPLDHAVFAEPTGDITVTIDANVAPSSITISHSANSITFTGSSITGSTGISKTGAGTFTLANNNTFTGPISVAAGTFQLGAGGTTGIVSRTSAIDVAADAIFHFNRTNNDTGFSNAISGSGTLLKTGGNEFGFTGANTFSGLIDIQSGKIGLTSVDSENGQPSVNIASGATFSVGAGFEGGICTIGNLSGAGNVDTAFGGSNSTRTLEVNQTVDETFTGRLLDANNGRILAFRKAGPATLTLTGNNTYSGPTTIAEGTLVMPTRSMPASHFTLADNAALTVINSGQPLTTGDFTLGDSGTSTLTLQGVATASGLALVNCQTLATNGTTTLNLSGGYFPVGSHKLISYTSRTGSGGFTVGNLPEGVSGTIVDTGSSINLLVDSFTPLTWNGPDNAIWDLNAANWKIGTSTGLTFKNGDVVRFDTTAPGSIVDLDDYVEPLVTAFDFDAPATYLLTGFGGIDSGDFVKSGTGTLTIETVNAHTGTTSVAGGTLIVGVNGALGNAPGGVTVSEGASLELNSFSIPAGKALSLSGSLINSSETAATYNGPVTFQTGNPQIGGSGTVSLASAFTGSANFVKTGPGIVNTNADSNTFAGSILVNEGTLNLTSTIRASAGITVNPGATASIGRTNMFVANHGEAMAASRILTVNGGTLIFNSLMDSRFGNITLHNGGTLTSNRGLTAWDALFAEINDGGTPTAATLAVTGTGTATMNGTGGIHLGGVQNFNIADTTGNPDADLIVNMILDKRGNNPGPAGGINKLGAGTMHIESNSSYDGETLVSEGTLVIAGALTATSSVTVASGATLAGSGTLGGPVTIQSGGTHALEIAAEPGQQATRSITGALTLETGNILTLTTAATPIPGTYILAVASGGITGTPGALNLPSGVAGTVAVNGNNLELTVSGEGSSDYDTWAASFNLLGAPAADDDNDGLSNFQEYAFGLNPTSASSVSPITAPDKSAGTFTYTRRKPSLTGLNYTHQSSTTLAGWTTFTPASQASDNGDPVETITITLPAALLAEPKLFLRVEAVE